MDNLSAAEFSTFCNFLELNSGIVLSPNKQYLVSNRLNRLLADQNIPSLNSLLLKIQSPVQEALAQQVIDAMTTNETNWFRDEYPFNILLEKLLPELPAGKRTRIWCAACSSGQEPYSIAIKLDEARRQALGYKGSVEIIGTDLSNDILQQAKSAEFDSLSLARGLSPERKMRYFDQGEKGSCTVKPSIRQQVQFKKLNLKDSYNGMGKFDVIFCRNVLIYFSAELKSDILQRLSLCLNPGGYLFLGASESTSGYSDKFEMVRCSPGIVYKLKS